MYSHSVALESEKCIGCTDCIKRCPTEAIRVRDSKAKIIKDRCIDCGNCIAVCRNGAKKAVMDNFSMIYKYPYRVALPAPSLYAQFSKGESVEDILASMYAIGFTDVFEVSQAAEYIAAYTRKYMQQDRIYPVISSACPVIVRLIQRRFPALIDHILPIMSPMELAARYVKTSYGTKGIEEDQVGVFFISPCPAKATDIHKPKGLERSYVDGAFSMQEIYLKVVHDMQHPTKQIKRKPTPGGMSWATRNGGIGDIGIDNHIAVDGIERVIDVLEKVEDGTLSKIHYVEALACTGGCLGGALTIENPFVSRHTLKKLIEVEEKVAHTSNPEPPNTLMERIPYNYNVSIVPKPVFSLDEDIGTAIEMMEKIETLYSKLPQIDCGSCGAPTCRCFAEDVVKGYAHVEDCVFMLRKRIKELSEAMFELTQKILPTTKD
ncbi:MAG: [Fe-Fe] hydrogenase large subunit C-terminal domain-containing protein [Niameybacter sp.]|uniref:[Fe-Fe] hydrogenase large subunit C-terminal domain-containing protein n=1 Tax=Niameybacter sp. TaxID=2033640 RepID=UPI002FC763FF